MQVSRHRTCARQAYFTGMAREARAREHMCGDRGRCRGGASHCRSSAKKRNK